jgi:hypothetical protein
VYSFDPKPDQLAAGLEATFPQPLDQRAELEAIGIREDVGDPRVVIRARGQHAGLVTEPGLEFPGLASRFDRRQRQLNVLAAIRLGSAPNVALIWCSCRRHAATPRVGSLNIVESVP